MAPPALLSTSPHRMRDRPSFVGVDSSPGRHPRHPQQLPAPHPGQQRTRNHHNHNVHNHNHHNPATTTPTKNNYASSSRRPPRTGAAQLKKLRDRNDCQEESGAGADNSSGGGGVTPTPSISSVHLVGGLPLARDLSDLSGSYAAAAPARRGRRGAGAGAGAGAGSVGGASSSYAGGVPRDVYPSDQSATSHQRPWALARILSPSREPHAPQPPCMDCDDSVGHSLAVRIVKPTGTSTTTTTMVVVEQSTEAVELVKTSEDDLAGNRRTPLLILLMDPGRKSYELMQLWVDVEEDTVRDVLHSIQHSLNDRENWRQDYDGLFQVRNNHFSQLIHILNLSKYDVRPHELWIAKPWSMSAKATVGYAGGLLNYLKGAQVLEYTSMADRNSTTNTRWRKFGGGGAASAHHHSSSKPAKNDDSILVLTGDAKSRMYVPGGVLKHHHAYQFLSFSPPYEPDAIRVDVLGADVHGGNHAGGGGDAEDWCVRSQLSDSHAGMSMESSRLSFTDLITSRISLQRHAASTAAANNQNASPAATARNKSPARRRSPRRNRPNADASCSVSRVESAAAADDDDRPIVLLQTNYYSNRNNDYGSSSGNKAAAAGGGGFAKAMSILNCRNCKNNDIHNSNNNNGGGGDETILGSTVAGGGGGGGGGTGTISPLWQVWEEEGSKAGDSFVSESSKRPLLIARPPSYNYRMAEI